MSPGRREGSLIFVDVALGGPAPSAQKAPPSDMMPMVRLESGKKGREWTLTEPPPFTHSVLGAKDIDTQDTPCP